MNKMLRYSRIVGLGIYLPERIVTNHELTNYMDTSDEWIVQRTGIKERRFVELNQTTSDLAIEAANAALADAGMTKDQIDMILLATTTPDHEFPATACFMQAKMGLSDIPCMDIRQQCSAFIYAMSVADQFIKTGMYNNILVVGAEIFSKSNPLTTWYRDVAVLFGDGAGAVIMSPAEDPLEEHSSRIYSTHIHTQGEHAKELWCQAPGQAYPGPRISEEILARNEHLPTMNGQTVFLHAIQRMPEAVLECVKANGFKVKDVDFFVFHQANLRINEMVAKGLRIPPHKVLNTIDRYANTTTATIPLGLAAARAEGKLQKGQLIALAAFGAGFAWGSALLRW